MSIQACARSVNCMEFMTPRTSIFGNHDPKESGTCQYKPTPRKIFRCEFTREIASGAKIMTPRKIQVGKKFTGESRVRAQACVHCPGERCQYTCFGAALHFH